jgi:protein SCO1/2
MPECRDSRRRDRRAVLAVFGVAAGLLLVSGGYRAWLGRKLEGRPRGSTAIGGAFRLPATDGRMVDPARFAGRYRLIYFGYTHCPDVCPTTLATLAEALRRMGGLADRVHRPFGGAVSDGAGWWFHRAGGGR